MSGHFEQNASADPTSGTSAEMEDPIVATRSRVLSAALPNVAFDGWSDATLTEAISDSGVDPHAAKLAFPRGGVDLAIAHHRAGDEEMRARLAEADLEAMRIRERVAFAIRTRLEIAARHREAARRAASLFALPPHAGDGARMMWETADHIWTGLGDPSEDLNWYTKRAILAGVYSSAALYWLGDESEGFERSWRFVDRRIEDVMRFEKLKSAVNANPLGRMLMTGPNWLAERIRKPGAGDVRLPG